MLINYFSFVLLFFQRINHASVAKALYFYPANCVSVRLLAT